MPLPPLVCHSLHSQGGKEQECAPCIWHSGERRAGWGMEESSVVTMKHNVASLPDLKRKYEDLPTIVTRRKLQWYGHVSRSSGLAKTILQGTVKGGKTTSGNGQAWSSASPRGQWRTGKMEKTGCKIICGAPTTLAVKGLMMMMMKTQSQS